MIATTPLLLIAALQVGDDDFKREADLSHLEGKPAPALQVEGWINSDPIGLAELRGKVVVLDFWGVW